jgi:hypothetical protein
MGLTVSSMLLCTHSGSNGVRDAVKISGHMHRVWVFFFLVEFGCESRSDIVDRRQVPAFDL